MKENRSKGITGSLLNYADLNSFGNEVALKFYTAELCWKCSLLSFQIHISRFIFTSFMLW